MLHLDGEQLELAKYLIVEKKCDPLCKNNVGTTPCDIAVREGHLELAKFFDKGMLQT